LLRCTAISFVRLSTYFQPSDWSFTFLATPAEGDVEEGYPSRKNLTRHRPSGQDIFTCHNFGEHPAIPPAVH
jgi:hypothetical protein